MAGVIGNSAWVAYQRQASGAKGVATASLATAIKSPFAGGTIGPNREIGQLAETDANRDQGVSYVKTSGVKGSPDVYVRDAGIVPLLQGVLGTRAAGAETKAEFEGEVKGTAGELSEIIYGGALPTGVVVGAEVNDVAASTKFPAGTTITSINTGTKKMTTSEPSSGVIANGAKSLYCPLLTHTLTPANAMPYYTFWSMLGAGSIYEVHKDCKISDLEIKASAGSPLTATVGMLGRESELLGGDPFLSAPNKVPLQNGTPYNYNNATVTLGGGATALVGGMTLAISNNVTTQQTDDVIPLDVAEGKRTVTIGFDLIFENATEYTKFHYNGGTKISSELFLTNMTYVYSLGTNNSIEFKVPFFAYEEFPVAPEVQGAPLVVSLKGVAQRNAGNIMEAVVKNQHKTY